MNKRNSGILIAVGAVFLAVVVTVTSIASASRNSSGTYSIPNTFTSGSVISSSAVNANFSDIGTELTSSLDRAGRGAMTAQLQLASGTVATPGLGFSSDTGMGAYRIGSGDLGIAVGGVKKLELTSSLFTVTPAASFTSTIAAGGKISNAVSGTASSVLGEFLEASLSDGNFVQVITGFGTSSNQSATLTYTKNATAANSTACLGLAGATSTLCVDGNSTTAITKPTIATGVGADGSGFKHQSVAGCATGAAVGSSCDTVLTWTTQFADTSYQAVCSCSTVTSGKPYIGAVVTTATQVTVTSIAATAVAAQCTNLVCFGVHN